MSPTLTPEQHLAITRREVSIALSAGAGCGKTFVLTERFLSHLEPDAEPRAELHHLVAITFTDRAAREMRDRVRQKCHEKLLAASADHSAYWLNLLRDLDTARVSTIHSFCTSLLRSHAVEAGLDPRFGVLEQSVAETLLAELVDDLLRDKLSDHDESTLALASVHGLAKLKSMLQGLVTRSNESDLDAWQETTAEELVSHWSNFLREHVLPSLLRQIATSESALAVLHILQNNEATGEKMQARRATLLEVLPALPSSTNPAQDIATLLDAARVQGAGKTPFTDPKAYEQFKNAAKSLRDEIKKRQEPLTFDPDSALPAAAAGLELLELTRELDARFHAAKRELRALDFNDLIRRASKLLTAPESESLRKRVASQIQLLMVDEFQDTSPAQVALVRALCGDNLSSGKLFFVGDHKQSIYRFRGANPSVVSSLREDIPTPGRLPLSRNFRSQPAIINFVNTTFAPAFGEAYESLVPHREQITPEPAIEFLWATPDENDENDRGPGSRQRSRKREADWIARRIRQMIDQGDQLVANDSPKSDDQESPTRGVQPGDVVILFRALSDIQHYEEALRRHGLDYYLVGGHAFYAQQEIYDLLNLLRAVANPSDEVSLAGVLRSPFFSLTDETLFWLSHRAKQIANSSAASDASGASSSTPLLTNLYTGLAASQTIPELEGPQKQLALAAAQTFAELRSLKDRLPVAELIQLALDRTSYDAVLLAEFLGERKLANLQKLIDQARTFDQSGLFGLDDFLVQLSEFVVKQPHEPLAATQPETTDVVRLMTIHQAKGLEFPVVVVADLERAGTHQPGDVALSDQLGPLTRWRDPQGAAIYSGFDLHHFVEREQDQQESTRLFYVACTRAADYLILSSGINQTRWPESHWTKTLARVFDITSGELLGDPNSESISDPSSSDPTPTQLKITREEPKVDKNKETSPRTRIEESLKQAIELAASIKTKGPNTAAPIPADQTARRQFSFSRLTGQFHGHSVHDTPSEQDNDDAPAFSTETENTTDPIDPRAFGSLVHAALEHIPFHAPTSSDESSKLQSLINRLAPKHALELGPATSQATGLIERFLISPQAAELAAAQSVHREIEFLLAWPPNQPATSDAFSITIQGFIDCLYQGADGNWRILDYKTNNISEDQIPATAAQYEMQMQLYALAAEQVLGQAPTELILHFLRPNATHRFPWNEEAKTQIINKVNQAIEKTVKQ